MAFEKNNWKSGDVISSTKLNAMEDGIVEGLEPVAWGSVTGKPSTFTPAAHTHAWADVTGKPATFAPATHTHTIANVTGLQALLDDLETRLATLETPAG